MPRLLPILCLLLAPALFAADQYTVRNYYLRVNPSGFFHLNNYISNAGHVFMDASLDLKLNNSAGAPGGYVDVWENNVRFRLVGEPKPTQPLQPGVTGPGNVFRLTFGHTYLLAVAIPDSAGAVTLDISNLQVHFNGKVEGLTNGKPWSKLMNEWKPLEGHWQVEVPRSGQPSFVGNLKTSGVLLGEGVINKTPAVVLVSDPTDLTPR